MYRHTEPHKTTLFVLGFQEIILISPYKQKNKKKNTSSSLCSSFLSHCLSEERTERRGARGGESVSRHTIPAFPAARAVQITRGCQWFDRLPTRYSLSSPPLTARFKALFVLISKFVFLEWEITEQERMFSWAREGGDEKLFLPHKPPCDLRWKSTSATHKANLRA